VASVGFTGDSQDNALAGANSLFKAELLRSKGPWTTSRSPPRSSSTGSTVRCLHGEIGLRPPVEIETDHYRQNTTPEHAEAALRSLH
jgi:putative transposase